MKFFDYTLTTTIKDSPLVDLERQEPLVVNCLNPHSFVTALEDEDFHSALKSGDMLLPDGEGICMALHRWSNRKIEKIAGSDLHKATLEELENMNGSIYYMGSSDYVLERIKERIAREYPHVRVRSYSPPYKPMLDDEDNQRICEDIIAFAPNVLMVGMTAPKQEKWIHANKGRLQDVKLIGAVGGVFDFYAGTIKRAPQWAIKAKMEWLWRFAKEPRRMWQRNMVSTPRFLRYCRKHKREI